MNFNYIFNSVSLILKYIAIVLLVPCICAFILHENYALKPFIYTASLSYLLSFILKGKEKSGEELNNINRSEALATVLLSWVLFSLLSSVIFLYFGLKPIDALFESVSGVTTTGASILSDFSIYPETMLFWRSFSQWLGGMGILVLFIAILPQFAIAGRQMFFAESPGASSTDSKLTPRIRQTAFALWSIYFSLTLLEFIILTSMGMPVFDAVCHSLSTLAGGGLSTHPLGIMIHSQAKFIWTIAFFMILSGTNFALLYKVIVKRKFSALFKDEEFKTYIAIIILFTLFISVTLTTHNIYNLKESIEAAFFQVVSIITTTGFTSVDYAQWNLRAQLLLFILMFSGASIGSAAGGVKILRLIFIFKYLRRQISKIYHPNGVYPIKINKVIINEDTVRQMISFVIFYYTIFALTAVILTFIEQDAVIGVSTAITTLGNVGPGFGSIVGPVGNFGSISDLSKLISILNMLIGRLEIIPFLALLHPDFWTLRKRNSLHKIKNI